MNLVKPSLEIWEQKASLPEIYKHIEKCARVCYKSEEYIKEGSAEKMVKRLIESKHGAMLEHGTVYLQYNYTLHSILNSTAHNLWYKYALNKYSFASLMPFTTDSVNGHVVITTNYRVIIENGWEEDLIYQCEPTEHHMKRVTVKFVLSRSIANEFVRHRVFSFAQESTRYCSYNKDKFNNSITYIIPSHLNIPEGQSYYKDGFGFKVGADLINYEFDSLTRKSGYESFLIALDNAEASYFKLLQQGWQPQQAREVLPLSLKTELIMTGTIEQWEGFFKLRDAGAAHPDAVALAKPLHELFKEKYGIK